MDCFSVAVEECRTVYDWIEEKIEQPIEDWENRQEQRCRDADCNWWVLCLNKLICWLVVIVVKVIRWVIVTVGKWVVRLICAIVSFFICVVWQIIVYAFIGPISWAVIKLIDWLSGKDWLHGNPPTITTPEQANNNYCRQTKDTYEKLSWFDELVAIFSTPFKEFGIRGWTDYHMHACAKGKVFHAAKSTDGLYTVDIEIADGDFVVDGHASSCEARFGYIRAEIFPRVTFRMEHLPQVGDTVRICGGLFWDADGFLEIHPGVGEVTLL